VQVKSFKQYLVPKTVEEAVGLRAQMGSGVLYIAGGTTVVPAASRGVKTLIDINRLELDYVEINGGSIRLGAGTRLAALVTPEIERALPMLYKAAHACATPLIRNMATVGGALSGIFLPSDIGIPLLALGAKVLLQGEERHTGALEEMLLEGWPPGDDLIIEVEVPLPGERTGCGFEKFARNAIDISLVNIAAMIKISEAGAIEALRLAVGQSLSPPVLLKEADLPVGGELLSEGLVQRIAGEVSAKVKARSDSKASSEYRKHLIEVLAARSIAAAINDIGVGIGD
jgi:CO/xanthine dehydrogenase FAD-binding subunit